MNAMASLIIGVSIVYSTVCSGADQRKHQSSASLAFVRGIHRWQVKSPHIGPVTRKMFPYGEVIMSYRNSIEWLQKFPHVTAAVFFYIYVLYCLVNKQLSRIGYSSCLKRICHHSDALCIITTRSRSCHFDNCCLGNNESLVKVITIPSHCWNVISGVETAGTLKSFRWN